LEWGYDLRLDLLNYEIDLAFSPESLPAFAWILQTYDENPELFNEEDFLWQYKWMMSDLYENPDVSKAQIEAALKDFETRLLRNGYGMRAIYNEEFSEALAQKDTTAIQESLTKVLSVERDDMSDCLACEMDAEVSAILYTQGFTAAYAKATPLFEKKFTCAHVPLRTAVNLAYEGQKLGFSEQAAKAAELASTEILLKEKEKSITLSAIKLALYYAYTDKKKGKEWLEKYIPWVDGREDRTVFYVAKFVVDALKEYPADEVFHLELPETHQLFKGDTVFTKTELQDNYAAIAQRIAAKFDQRNGNAHFSNQLIA